MIKVIISSIVGAVILMVCGFISWQFLKVHENSFSKASNEVILSNALSNSFEKDSGSKLIMIPSLKKGATEEECNENMKKTFKGPYFFGVIRSGSRDDNMSKMMIMEFATNFIKAFLLSLLLTLISSRNGYLFRVFFVTIVALLIAITANVHYHLWFEFPLRYTLVNMAVTIVSMFFASLGMSAIVRGK